MRSPPVVKYSNSFEEEKERRKSANKVSSKDSKNSSNQVYKIRPSHCLWKFALSIYYLREERLQTARDTKTFTRFQ
ncbi:hypothetical protein HNY73_022251 [Argiope bruennichi]|uniref:Uncharacterized protein n=1 Tax=Argiope bruennichi TaxID=94029 RepID=A0A8T0E3W5_ARGBR|nr:hypothetical protein HNY73_022251 [Argiope bruennichi]